MSDYEIYVCLFRLFELEATVSIIFLASGLSSGHHIDIKKDLFLHLGFA